MALASGADLKLGAYELFLARDQQDHYVHSYGRLTANRLDISGAPGKQGLIPEILLWGYDDWSGGEGNKFYDPNRPTVYYKGQANGRNPGELDPPPDRNSGTATTNATPNKIMFAASGGNLYMGTGNAPTAGGANHFYESTNGTTWTSKNSGFTTNDILTAMASDGTYVYLARNNAGNRYISRYTPSDGSNAAFNVSAAGNPWFGLAFLPIGVGGTLYAWNGRVLVAFDTTAALTVTGSTVYTSGVDVVPSSATGDVIAAENAVIFFYSAEGHSRLMEYKVTSTETNAHPLWTPPNGFVIKQIAYSLGNVFCLGNYANKLALFVFSLVSKQALFVGYIRPGTTLTGADIQSSFGADVMLLTTDGHVFIYNIASDTLSELDDATALTGTWGGCTTYKGLRIAAKYSTTTTTVYTWEHDDATLSTQQASFPESPAWDLGLPLADKVLVGFHVVSSTLDATNKVTISYDLDETGSYTALTSLTSGKTNFSALGTPTSFRQMRFKITTAGNAKVFAVYAECRVLATTQTWELLIDLRDRDSGTTALASERPDRIRWDILKAVENKGTLTFRDGTGFMAEKDVAWSGSSLSDVPTSGYREYTVAVESAEDHIVAGTATGILRVLLRSGVVT